MLLLRSNLTKNLALLTVFNDSRVSGLLSMGHAVYASVLTQAWIMCGDDVVWQALEDVMQSVAAIQSELNVDRVDICTTTELELDWR